MGKTFNKATLSNVEIEICSIEKQIEIIQVLNKMMEIMSGKRKELKFLDDLIKARFVEMFGDLKANSRGWTVVGFKECADIIKVSAIPVEKVVDTTGAGDYFASGFLYGLTCGYSLEKCAKIGSILSGNVIQVIGTSMPQERWDEIKLNINRILAE